MAKPAKTTPVSRAYAQSLLELASEQGQDLEAIGQELRDLRQVIEADPAFGEFLASPAISPAERGPVLERTLAGKVNPLLMNTVKLLNVRGRLGILPALSEAYDDLLEERLGKIEVDVTVAQKLDDEQLERVRQRVSEALGRDAVLHQYVDESIIGGMVLRVGDRLIDASVKTQLKAMRNQLMASRRGNGSVV